MSIKQKFAAFSTKEKLITIGLIIIGSAFVLFFGMRLTRTVREISLMRYDGVPRVENIRGWMTVHFIARVYEVPEELIFETLGVPPNEDHKKPLGRLERDYRLGGRETIIDQVQEAIRQYHDLPPPPKRERKPEP